MAAKHAVRNIRILIVHQATLFLTFIATKAEARPCFKVRSVIGASFAAVSTSMSSQEEADELAQRCKIRVHLRLRRPRSGVPIWQPGVMRNRDLLDIQPLRNAKLRQSERAPWAPARSPQINYVCLE